MYNLRSAKAQPDVYVEKRMYTAAIQCMISDIRARAKKAIEDYPFDFNKSGVEITFVDDDILANQDEQYYVTVDRSTFEARVSICNPAKAIDSSHKYYSLKMLIDQSDPVRFPIPRGLDLLREKMKRMKLTIWVTIKTTISGDRVPVALSAFVLNPNLILPKNSAKRG